MPLNKNDIKFLEDLEIKLQHQSQILLGNSEFSFMKDLINYDEFDKFYKIMDKLENDLTSNRKNARKQMQEGRKTNRGYGRPKWYQQYLKDKEQRMVEGKSVKGMYKEYELRYKNNKEG